MKDSTSADSDEIESSTEDCVRCSEVEREPQIP